LRDHLRDDLLRLLRVVQHAREDVAGLHPNEVTERQTLQMRVERIAQVTRHVFLKLRTQLAARPHEHVLSRDRDENDDDDPQQRCLGALAVQKRTEELILQGRQFRLVCRLVEQPVEKRDQQCEAEDVEHGCRDVARHRSSHAPRMRPEELEQAPVHHRARLDVTWA